MEKEKVSIIIPAYNVEKYLEKCVESLINQSYKNIEIIIVNDGSKDNTLDIANNLKLCDSRIIVLTKENGGLSSARNYGLRVATGEYVVFVDSDDYVSNVYIEYMLKYLTSQSEGLDLLTCDFVKVYEKTKNPFKRHYRNPTCKIFTNNEYISEMFSGKHLSFILAHCKIYKTSIAKDVMFDENLKHAEDVVFNYQYLLKAQNAGYLKAKLSAYLMRPGSLVHSKFSLRRFTMIKILIDYQKIEKERANDIRVKDLGTWIYLACLESFYFMLRDKVIDKESYTFLKQNLYANKKYLRANRKSNFFVRIFAPVGVWLINLFIKKENKK